MSVITHAGKHFSLTKSRFTIYEAWGEQTEAGLWRMNVHDGGPLGRIPELDPVSCEVMSTVLCLVDQLEIAEAGTRKRISHLVVSPFAAVTMYLQEVLIPGQIRFGSENGAYVQFNNVSFGRQGGALLNVSVRVCPKPKYGIAFTDRYSNVLGEDAE